MNIAIAGFAGSGKTTLANHIVEKYGFQKISFATPLKVWAEKIMRHPLDKKEDRQFLIDLGTYLKGGVPNDLYMQTNLSYIWSDVYKLRDIFKPDFFASYLVDQIKPDINYAVDDLRFLNEHLTLKKVGFQIIHLECARHICERRMIKRDGGFNKDVWGSPSEIEHLGFEYDHKLLAEKPLESFLADFDKWLEEQYADNTKEERSIKGPTSPSVNYQDLHREDPPQSSV